MEEKQAITVRLSEEAYGKVRKYADEIGESMGGAMCRIVDEFFKAVPSPPPETQPAPSPGPSPVPQPEIQDLQRRVRRLEEKEAAGEGYVKGLSERVDRLHWKVNEALAMLGVPPS